MSVLYFVFGVIFGIISGVIFAKKFILDALVKLGKLKDDNRKCVTAFRDTFSYGAKWKIILDIQEVEK